MRTDSQTSAGVLPLAHRKSGLLRRWFVAGLAGPLPRGLLPGILAWVILAWMIGMTAATAQDAAPGSTATREAGGSPDPRGPGTIEMARLLNQLAGQANPMENRFLNLGRVDVFRRALEGNPEPERELQARFQLATELLQVNRLEEALVEIRRVRSMAKALEMPLLEVNDINLSLREALCHMRRGELANCLSNHNADSCLLPLRGGGIYRTRDDSLMARSVLTNLLARHPDNLSARWLLNVAHMTLGEYPDRVPPQWLIPTNVFRSDHDIGRFLDVGPNVGLARTELSGGAVVDDFDGDGLLDVVTSSIGLSDPMRFFRNLGNGRFQERTREAGLEGLTGGLNLLHADFDNDGDQDILVLRGAWMGEGGRYPNSLLRNDGGRFEDVTKHARLLSFHPTQNAVWFDYNGDGWLDLFIGNESMPGGPPHPCELHRNNRDGTFTDVSRVNRLDVVAFVKGSTAIDYDNDGRPDLFLSVQDGRSLLFRNDGPKPGTATEKARWGFTEVAEAAGVTGQRSTFPCWSFDYDNDGFEDLFVAGYRIRTVGEVVADMLGMPSPAERARLYRNRGNGTFEDVSKAVGLDRVLHAMGSNFGDLDNDGWLDFYLGTGDPNFDTLIPNRMFRNDGGRRFQDVTTSGGFGTLQKGHAVAFADLDNDGDQDVYEDLGGAYHGDQYPNALLENPGHGNHWIKLKLEGRTANRSGIGARIRIRCATPDGDRIIHRTCNTGGSFGGNPLRLEIGLGRATEVKSVEIDWPGSRSQQSVKIPRIDSAYRIREGESEVQNIPLKPMRFMTTHAEPHSHHHPSPAP